MSGIRPRATLPASPQRPSPAPPDDAHEVLLRLRRARAVTWCVVVAGLVLLAAGAADIALASSDALVLLGLLPLALGLLLLALSERRLARLAAARAEALGGGLRRPRRARGTGLSDRDPSWRSWGFVGSGSDGGSGSHFDGGGGDGGGGGS